MTQNRNSFFLNEHTVFAPDLQSGLYIVSTPIGHLKDITIRALETLSAVDLIACEDTRVSKHLLTHYGITTPLMTYHEHNADQAGQIILQKLASCSVALMSDAGTPLLSDPGHRLVKHALSQNFPVTAIPGASAVLTAYVASGLGDSQFYFAGFLPTKTAARKQVFETLVHYPATLIFYESPKRLARSLKTAVEIFGPDRFAVVARELTKRFESFYRGTLSDLFDIFSTQAPPKGEIVLLISRNTNSNSYDLNFDRILLLLMDHLPLKQAVEEVISVYGLSRRLVYSRALELRAKQ